MSEHFWGSNKAFEILANLGLEPLPNVHCIPSARASEKVPVTKDADFSLETLCFDGQRRIEVIHDVLRFMIRSRDLLLSCNVLGFHS